MKNMETKCVPKEYMSRWRESERKEIEINLELIV